ncbi:hypothetical protein K438DRAFT_1773692 [Mycena galopus ATCC 62051]|nr:hypothetical protein K438DRAFT_1773692 [Mycena galopus ATCC 62051]
MAQIQHDGVMRHRWNGSTEREKHSAQRQKWKMRKSTMHNDQLNNYETLKAERDNEWNLQRPAIDVELKKGEFAGVRINGRRPAAFSSVQGSTGSSTLIPSGQDLNSEGVHSSHFGDEYMYTGSDHTKPSNIFGFFPSFQPTSWSNFDPLLLEFNIDQTSPSAFDPFMFSQQPNLSLSRDDYSELGYVVLPQPDYLKYLGDETPNKQTHDAIIEPVYKKTDARPQVNATTLIPSEPIAEAVSPIEEIPDPQTCNEVELAHIEVSTSPDSLVYPMAAFPEASGSAPDSITSRHTRTAREVSKTCDCGLEITIEEKKDQDPTIKCSQTGCESIWDLQMLTPSVQVSSGSCENRNELQELDTFRRGLPIRKGKLGQHMLQIR